jgi:hypothetical protein
VHIINEKALEENNVDYVDQYMYQQKNNDDHVLVYKIDIYYNDVNVLEYNLNKTDNIE